MATFDWDMLPECEADGRGAPETVKPALQAVHDTGTPHTFGPFKTKGSASNSLKAYQKRQEADGLTFSKVRGSDSTGWGFKVSRP